MLGHVAGIAGIELDLLLGDDVVGKVTPRDVPATSAGNDQLGLEVTLGLEAHALGAQRRELLEHAVQLRFGERRIERDQRLAGLDAIALARVDALDDPAFQMLDQDVLAGRGDVAGRDGGAGQRRRRRPQAEAAEEDDHEQIAERRDRSGARVDRLRPGEDRGFLAMVSALPLPLNSPWRA